MEKTIASYNIALSAKDKTIANLLKKEIDSVIKNKESKIWHGHPVWFIDGNPIVGYAKRKNDVSLLFWSGQSFKESGLQKEGSFKAAEAKYTDVKQIKVSDIRRWLKKAKTIQWDYKNIVKRKGRLVKIK